VTISAELEAQILRYYHVERWRPRTIARQLHVHKGTVARDRLPSPSPQGGGLLASAHPSRRAGPGRLGAFWPTRHRARPPPLMAFVMVLSYSRQIFLRFFLNARLGNFLRGHVGAFDTWRGLPRTLLYDNLKSVVLERQGDAIRFHPTLLEFASHYRFDPRPWLSRRGMRRGESREP
jgi:hypothetical protein